jgi:hypothetical protein
LRLDPQPASRIAFPAKCGGQWFLAHRRHRWQLEIDSPQEFAAHITIPQSIAWRVFTKGISREAAR